MTVHLFIVADGVSASLATDPVPFLDRDMGTGRVVSPEDVCHDRKKVVNPTVFQCPLDGGVPIPLAKFFTADVRMGHIRIAARRLRVASDHPITTETIEVWASEVQLNGEWTEIQSFQFDRLGRDSNPFTLEVELDVVEFFPQGPEFEQEFARGQDVLHARSAAEPFIEFREGIAQAADGIPQVSSDRLDRRFPIALGGDRQSAMEPAEPTPPLDRQRRKRNM